MFWLLKLSSSFRLGQLWVSSQPRTPGLIVRELTTSTCPAASGCPAGPRSSGLSAVGSARASPDKSLTSGEGGVGVTTSPKCKQLTGLAAAAGRAASEMVVHGWKGTLQPSTGAGRPSFLSLRSREGTATARKPWPAPRKHLSLVSPKPEFKVVLTIIHRERCISYDDSTRDACTRSYMQIKGSSYTAITDPDSFCHSISWW